jgi:hypothetical protein
MSSSAWRLGITALCGELHAPIRDVLGRLAK